MVSLLALGMTCQGCRVLEGTYAGNRLDDLTDVAYIELSAISFGALANVGPLLVGYEQHGCIISSKPSWNRLGFGGLAPVEVFDRDRGKAYGVVVPLSYARLRPVRRLDCAPQGETPDWYRIWPRWGSVGMRLGYLVSFGASIDVVEFADFVLGLGTIAFLADDWREGG